MPPPVPAATTVQLPTFSVFTVQTTVSVPDRGTAYLGGISRGADGSTVRGIGPLGSRGIGGTRGASGISASATIIDHSELDRAILAKAAEARGTPANPQAAKATELSRGIARGDGTLESVAAIRERKALQADERAAEVAQWLASAQQAEEQGKLAVARVFYQMVTRHGAAAQKDHAAARLAALAARPAVAAASTSPRR
jgi:hypothetical protein